VFRVQQRRAELAKVVAMPPESSAERQAEIRRILDAVACAEDARQRGAAPERVEGLLSAAFVDGLAIGPAYALRGRLALERGRLSKALADAEQAIHLSPKEWSGYLVRGRVRLERASSGAMEDLQRAVELSGRKNADALSALAEAQLRAGRREQALATQREAVKLRPEDKELQAQLSLWEKTPSEKPVIP
jgi:tetratricopeptide (TPR) repeat protein